MPVPFPERHLSPETLVVLYEDNHLIAVHKPAGVLVQGDRSGDRPLMDVVKEYIKTRDEKPGNVFLGLVHRLDRPVCGVVLFAKTSKAASRLGAQWRARTVRKVYWALVHGALDPGEGTLRGYLAKHRKRTRAADQGDGEAREASLAYRTLHRRGGWSLLEIRLHTGRKHQIRVQLALAGCPVAGDVKYGAPSPLMDKTIALLARSLAFTHPTTGEEVVLFSPLPWWCGGAPEEGPSP